MQVKILDSPYCEVPPGTIGTLVKPHADGWWVLIKKSFTVPQSCPVPMEQERTLFFCHAQLEFNPIIDSPSETKPVTTANNNK